MAQRWAPVVCAVMLWAGFSGGQPVEPIKMVEVGKNREFRVNGRPFFPIMSWAQSAERYQRLAQMGFNTHTSGKADVEAAKAAGCYAVTSFDAGLIGHSHLLGWIHRDEPDMPQGRGEEAKPRMSPEEIVGIYQRIKEADKTRPVFLTFTAYFMKEYGRFPQEVKEKVYPEFVKGCDVVGFDIYPIYGSGHASHLDWVAKGVSQLRAIGGEARPLYAWIETSKGSKWMTYEKQPDVLPIHTRAEVWMAIIRGATAIGYFTHAWRPSFTEFAPTQEMQAELARLNAQIARLAPAILADPASEKIEMSITGNLACHWKATRHEGMLYIFCQNIDLGEGAEKLKQFDPIHPRGGAATIRVEGLKAGTKIEVVDENRTLVAAAGYFTDEFAPLAEHIYRIR